MIFTKRLAGSIFSLTRRSTEAELESAQIGRVGDVLASEDEYREAGEWISGFCNQLDQTRPYSTREFFHLIGRELSEIASEDGLLTSAYKSRVPVFVPQLPIAPLR
ncbi:MAG: deoxyhypusine synthase family protein [Pyrinomonadaceae bacterium]